MANTEKPENYSEMQEEYNTLEEGVIYETLAREYAEIFCRRISEGNPEQELKILDIGCRTGYAVETMLDLLPNCRAVGVDVVPDFVNEGNEQGLPLIVGDVCEGLPFDTDSQDAIFACQVLEHCYDLPKALKELHRLLRPYGWLFVSLPLESQKGLEGNPSHHYAAENPLTWLQWFPQSQWFLQGSGFDARLVRYANYWFRRL